MGTDATLPLWSVEEKKHKRWEFQVRARTAAEARRLAAVWCGFTEPSTARVIPEPPRPTVVVGEVNGIPVTVDREG